MSVFGLLRQSHTAVHLHPNNCCGLRLVKGVPLPGLAEVTFLRNDRSSFWPYCGPIPTPLDFPNVAGEDEIILQPWT